MIPRATYFFPVLLLFVVFLLDKIFGLPIVTKNTFPYKKIERNYYESKEHLIQVLIQEYQNSPSNTYGVVFGSSRSGSFDYLDFQKVIPNSKTFNFSAPLAPPSVYYYWWKLIQETKVPIRYVIIEIDPILLSKASIRYSLESSYDIPFVLNHTKFWKGEGFSFIEAESYLNKKLFALAKYPVDLKSIIANNSEIKAGFFDISFPGYLGKDQKEKMIQSIHEANRIKFGALPNDLHFTNHGALIEVDSENIFQTYLKNYQGSETQWYFLKELVLDLTKKNIPIVLYIPATAPPLRRKMEDSGILNDFLVKLHSRLGESDALILDIDQDSRWTCRDFFDAVHLSGKCFSNILPILLEPFQSKL